MSELLVTLNYSCLEHNSLVGAQLGFDLLGITINLHSICNKIGLFKSVSKCMCLYECKNLSWLRRKLEKISMVVSNRLLKNMT